MAGGLKYPTYRSRLNQLSTEYILHNNHTRPSLPRADRVGSTQAIGTAHEPRTATPKPPTLSGTDGPRTNHAWFKLRYARPNQLAASHQPGCTPVMSSGRRWALPGINRPRRPLPLLLATGAHLDKKGCLLGLVFTASIPYLPSPANSNTHFQNPSERG